MITFTDEEIEVYLRKKDEAEKYFINLIRVKKVQQLIEQKNN